MEYLIVVLGIVAGFSVAYIIFNRKNHTLQLEYQGETSKIDQLKNDAISLKSEVIKLNSEKQILQDEQMEMKLQVNSLSVEHSMLLNKISELEGFKTDFEKLKEEKTELEKHQHTLTAKLKAEEEKLSAQFEVFNQQKDQLKNEFKVLANEILDQKSKNFSEQSKRDIDELINPMKEKIDQFKKQVTDAFKDDERERFSLKEQLLQLEKYNRSLSEEAKNLTMALKGDNKTQGDWGEMILENILENSGLTKGREYFVQQSFVSEDNQRLRPDVIVKYPGERFVVIDSKVSLRNYESYVNALNAEEQKKHLKLHIESIKNHIKSLSSKNYKDLIESGKTPEFVMMFLPIEPAYLLAVQNDFELWNQAYRKQILLISPTNLIAALRMIAELWEHDKQNKNVLKIAEESGKMVDKIVAFLEDFEKIGDNLKKSSDFFDKAKSKLIEGKGNISSKAQLISKLGATAKKTLPSGYLTKEDELDFENTDLIEEDAED